MSKLVNSIEDAIRACGLRDGMAIDFHHHLRNGDLVLPLVVSAIDKMGYKDIRLCSSGIIDGMVDRGLRQAARSGAISMIDSTGAGEKFGHMISRGELPRVCKYRTHGGRPRAIMEGDTRIDVAFIAAPTADPMGNFNGVEGPNACGAMGYSMTTVRHAKRVVVLTDNLVPYPLQRASVDEGFVDFVVRVDSIGDPAGIATGIARPTRDPVALILAEYTAETIFHSGLVKDGFSFQAGAGGPSIATTRHLSDYMKKNKIQGSYILGGITGASVDLLNEGLFETIQDVQCFDLKAIESLRTNPRHREISDSLYANPLMKSNAGSNLDVVVLGALEIDLGFNCNLAMNSAGYLSAGSGGHSDTAAMSKLAIIVAPLTRTRYPTVLERVTSVTTPGKDIDVLVTQYGVAVNPNKAELRQRLKDGGVKVVDIEELHNIAVGMTGKPKAPQFGDRLVAEIIHRDGYVIDEVYNVVG